MSRACTVAHLSGLLLLYLPGLAHQQPSHPATCAMRWDLSLAPSAVIFSHHNPGASNRCSLQDWACLEARGLLLLPASGGCYGIWQGACGCCDLCFINTLHSPACCSSGGPWGLHLRSVQYLPAFQLPKLGICQLFLGYLCEGTGKQKLQQTLLLWWVFR